MTRVFAVSLFPVLLAVSAGPIGFAMQQAGRLDPSHLYLVVGHPTQTDGFLARQDTREVGPYRAPFAQLIETSPEFHAWLVAHGYVVFPASALAALCGLETLSSV